MVAVGTVIAYRPPHRSRRALLTHRAPPSGIGVEAVTGERVQYPDGWKESCDEAGVFLPGDEGTLTAAPERPQPVPTHLVEEPPQARAVPRDGKVVQVPLQHPFQPRSGFRDGVVQSLAQFHLDVPEPCSHTLLDRLAPDDEAAPLA